MAASRVVRSFPLGVALIAALDYIPAHVHDRRIEADLGYQDPIGLTNCRWF